MPHPLFPEFNQPIDFKKVGIQEVQAAKTRLLNDAKAALEAIYHVPDSERTFANTADALDALYANVSLPFGAIYLLANTTSEQGLQQSCLQVVQELQQFLNQLSLDEKLYRAVKAYSQTPEAQQLTGYREKFLRETVEDFERNGLALPAEEREKLRAIKDKISDLSTQFQQNIATYKDELVVSEAEIEGLPEDYKKAHRNEDGTYTITMDYPSFRPFMQQSHSGEARRKLMHKYLNRATDKNLALLEEVLKLRKQLVGMLGYDSFAAYRVADRMAKTPDQVWDFEQDLQKQVRPKAEADYAELLKKKQQTHPEAEHIYQWESAYWTHQLLKTDYQVDSEEVKQYFELENVISGIFAISEKLYNVRFSRVENPSVWHEEVQLYEIQEADGTVQGRIYLDLFPRENKFNHAACFPMIPSRQTSEGRQIPTAALVCNFPRPTDERPSLLPHNEVETLFHEFGHGLHHLLTTSPLASFSGTSVKRDFVEVPSQHFENWAWHYDSLRLFARHFKTDEVLPEALFERMTAAKNVGSGLHTLQQILYGTYDFTLHSSYEPVRDGNTTELYRRLQKEISLYEPLEDTHFEAAFGHLMGYAAGYYGYLWAKVFAEDVFSVFRKQGVLSPEVGQAYKEKLLALGGTVEESEQLKDFLGREPEPEAFLKSIGLSNVAQKA